MKLIIITVLLFLAIESGCLDGSDQNRENPNILFILVDDLGWTDLSTGKPNLGNTSTYYETPNVDRLAEKGMSFTNAYTCGPNCAPTRAALMSGQYGTRTKMYTVSDPNRSRPEQRGLEAADNKLYLDLEQVTVAEVLKSAGYATAHFGKWHLGGHHGGGLPDAQGFDVNIGGTNVGGSTGGFFANAEGAFPPKKNAPRMPGLPANGKAGEWLDDRLTDDALSFMETHKNQHFFIYMSFFAVHTPISAPADDITHFDNKAKTDYHDNQTYAGFIKSFDDNLGILISYLEKTDDPNNAGKKLIENTAVIFYSDNGGLGGFERSGINGLEITDQYPLRDGKGSLKEGGIRVPMIVRWDGNVKAGHVNHNPIITVDFYPTFVEIANVETPVNKPLDGISLVDVLKGRKMADRALYWHFPAYLNGRTGKDGKLDFRTTPVSVVRKGDYKLLFYYETRHWELYNLTENIGEDNNLADLNQQIVKKMGKILIEWLIDTEADLPRDKNTGKVVALPEIPMDN